MREREIAGRRLSSNGAAKFDLPLVLASASGLSAAKARLSRKVGIPLSRSGRQQKLGRMVEQSAGLGCVGVVVLACGALIPMIAGTQSVVPVAKTPAVDGRPVTGSASGTQQDGSPVEPVPELPL